MGRERLVDDAGGESGADREIDRRFLDAHAADDVAENVELSAGKASPLIEDGKQQCESARIDPRGDALGCAEACACRQRLHFHKHRARPFHQCAHCAAAGDIASITNKESRRIFNRE